MYEKNKLTIWITAGVVVLVILGYFLYQYQKSPLAEPSNIIANFDDCVNAGFSVTGSNPRRCTATNGTAYTEEEKGDPDDTAVATGGCYIGGCSSQICSDQKDVITTCEYLSEYGCYKSARCERQSNNTCEWTQTPLLTQCLQTEFDLNQLTK